MSVRRVDYLVSDVREETDNPNTADTKDNTIIQYLNRGAQRLASVLSAKDATFLSSVYLIDLVADQKAYSLSDEILIKNRLISVEISNDTTVTNARRPYSILKQIQPMEQTNLTGYYVQQNQIYVLPVPSSSISEGLRVHAHKRPYQLDKRRGTISSLSPLTITSFATGETLPHDRLSIVNKSGTILVQGIVNDGFNSSSGVITTTSTLTGASIGDFVVMGGYSSTHSDLPESCERYLIEFAKLMLFHKDSNSDLSAQKVLLEEIEGDLLSMFAGNNVDAIYPPVINTEFLDYY